ASRWFASPPHPCRSFSSPQSGAEPVEDCHWHRDPKWRVLRSSHRRAECAFLFDYVHQCFRPIGIATERARDGSHGGSVHLHRFLFDVLVRFEKSVRPRWTDCLSRVRLPLWVWLSMVRVGFTLSLCDSVVAVLDLFGSPV